MFFKRRKPQEIKNHYAEYDSSNQLRPKINKGDFYSLTGFDLGWLLLEPINIAESREKEPQLAKRLSSGQKALYFWWYLDGQVTNGGFVQFYYNGYGIYVPAILAGLELIGDSEMLELLKQSYDQYLKHKRFIDKSRSQGVFGNFLYNRMKILSELDVQYYNINNQTMSHLERYMRENPNEFCLDENGEDFKTMFTGKESSYFENEKLKLEFHLTNGILNGEFKEYFESGGLKSISHYTMGKIDKERRDWHKNGKLKKIIKHDSPKKGMSSIQLFHENGTKKSEEIRDENRSKKGDYKEWYDNGQLKEHSTNLGAPKRNGARVEFWSNGNAKVEVDFEDGYARWKNYWDNDGNQLLKEGTGLLITERESKLPFGSIHYREETNYKNFKRDGISKSFKNGELVSETKYSNGKEIE